MKTIRHWQQDVHELAREKGWYDNISDDEAGEVSKRLLNVIGELSEAADDYAHDNMGVNYVNEKPVGFPIEIADAMIRLMDMAEWMKIDLEAMVNMKHQYNRKRSYRHGGKRI